MVNVVIFTGDRDSTSCIVKQFTYVNSDNGCFIIIRESRRIRSRVNIRSYHIQLFTVLSTITPANLNQCLPQPGLPYGPYFPSLRSSGYLTYSVRQVKCCWEVFPSVDISASILTTDINESTRVSQQRSDNVNNRAVLQSEIENIQSLQGYQGLVWLVSN